MFVGALYVAGCAVDTDAASSGELSLGPVIDADRQVAEATKAMSGRDGYWANAPDPGNKAFAPEFDLRAFPKFTDEGLAARLVAPAAGAGQVSHTVDVVTVEILADGSSRLTIYDPAPGVHPEDLAGRLRAAGELGVYVAYHEPGDASILAPNDCAFGSARTSRCPVAFWRNNGLEDPLVRFNDHSGPSWPVSNAVPKWNQVQNIDSSYRFNACGAPAGARCIDVLSGAYGATGWIGRFSALFPTATQAGPYLESGQWIQLNDSYEPIGFTRNMAATHEVGHALGMGHNVFSGDVMFSGPNMREDIGGENPVLLAGLYSITR